MNLLFCLAALFIANPAPAPGVAGAYTLDKPAFHAAVKKAVTERFGAQGEAKVAELMKQFEPIAKAAWLEFQLHADGSFYIQGRYMEPRETRGTWKQDGEKITLTMTHEKGKATSSETYTAMVKNGDLVMPAQQGLPEMLLKRRGT